MAEFKTAYDERIEDGFNGALGLNRFQQHLENPEELI
jgi:hypothetical protein